MNMQQQIGTLPTAKADGSPTFHRDGTREVSYLDKHLNRWIRAKANEVDGERVTNASPRDLLRIERWGRMLDAAATPARRQYRRNYEKRTKMDGETAEQADLLDVMHDFHVVSGAMVKAFSNYFASQREKEQTED